MEVEKYIVLKLYLGTVKKVLVIALLHAGFKQQKISKPRFT